MNSGVIKGLTQNLYCKLPRGINSPPTCSLLSAVGAGDKRISRNNVAICLVTSGFFLPLEAHSHGCGFGGTERGSWVKAIGGRNISSGFILGEKMMVELGESGEGAPSCHPIVWKVQFWQAGGMAFFKRATPRDDWKNTQR